VAVAEAEAEIVHISKRELGKTKMKVIFATEKTVVILLH